MKEQEDSKPKEEAEYVGNIFGWKFSNIGLVVTFVLCILYMVLSRWNAERFQGDEPIPETDSLQVEIQNENE